MSFRFGRCYLWVGFVEIGPIVNQLIFEWLFVFKRCEVAVRLQISFVDRDKPKCLM